MSDSHHIKRIWFIVCFLLSNLQILKAQPDPFTESWRWVQFTSESGLPSNNVLDVIETPDSTLWAVCDAGIAWFDGYQWHTVKLPSHQSTEWKTPPCDYRDDSILIVLADGNWYAVGREGYSRLSVEPDCQLAYLSGDTILCLRSDSLFYLIRGLYFPCVKSRQLVYEGFKILHRTKGGAVWIRAADGLYRWEDNNWRMMFEFKGQSPALSYRIAENSAGAVFARFELPMKLRGMWEYLPGSRKPYRVRGGAGDIQALAISPSQVLIAAYYFGDVRIRSGTSWRSSTILQSKCKGLNNLFFRHNGDLIITTSEGINYYKGSSSRWRLLPYGHPETGAVNEVFVSRSGDIWIGTANGIIIYDKNGKSKTITNIGDVPMVTVTGLGEDQDGNIWISSGGAFDGSYRWDGSTWKHFQISNNKDGARFHKIRRDRQGRLWFLGLSKFTEYPNISQPGVFLYENNNFIPWGRDHDLPNTRVYAFDEDAEGRFWFGTQRGISKWEKGKIRHWTKAEGLRGNRVFTLAADKHRNVWFGHQIDGLGLGCIDSSGNVRYFTTSDGLINDFVWEVRVDSLDILWIATRGGLASYHDGVWSRFDEASGLQSNLLWPVLPLKEEVYVGTHGKGVAVLNRKESMAPAPRIVIDKPNIDGQNVHLSWRAYSFWGAKPPNEIITQYRIDDGHWSDWSKVHELDIKSASPGEHTISVQTRGLFSNSPQEVQHATFTILPPLYLRPVVLIPTLVLLAGLVVLGYILIDRKRRYNNDLRQREAKFRAVTQMTYSAIIIFKEDLSVIFSNRSTEQLTGYSQEELQRMKITDLLPSEDRSSFMTKDKDRAKNREIPQRAEFEILKRDGSKRWIDLTWGEIMFQEVPAVIGTAFDITERKEAELRIKALASELSATEQRSRKRMAAFLHDKIGHALALSKMKVDALREMDDQSSINQAVGEVHALLRDAIQTTRSFTFELSPPILYDLGLVPAIDWLVEEMQKREKIAVELHKPITKIYLKDEVRNVLFEGTRELLVNALKHSRAKRIDVSITTEDTLIKISVQDDGVGIDFSKMEKHQAGNRSFGLYNLRERLRDIGGRLEIESKLNQGTTIHMIAPMEIERDSR